MDIVSQIDEARILGKPLLLKGVLKNTPNWDYVMKYVNDKFNEKSKYPINGDGFLKNKDNEIVPMFKSGFFDLQMWFIDLPECQQMSDIFSLNNKVNPSAFKILIDFLGSGHPNNIHKDHAEVYSWTWINSVEYRIYKDKDYPFEQALDIHDQPYESFIIEAGDVMYMPKGIVHQSIINEPRVSLIVSIQ
jgi:hypothetical protein